MSGGRLLPDVCGYPISWIATVDVCSNRDVLRLPALAHHLFLFSNVWDLATLTKLHTEMSICRTKMYSHIYTTTF